jgi:NDP-sugar pyrophosphorylase family protein
MHIMLEQNVPVHVYHHDGEWMDIGRPTDFQKAQDQFEANQSKYMGV